MPRLTVTQMGDCLGVGAIVKQESFWLPTRTYTLVLAESTCFNAWVCLETGERLYYDTSGKKIDLFYKAHYAINNYGGIK